MGRIWELDPEGGIAFQTVSRQLFRNDQGAPVGLCSSRASSGFFLPKKSAFQAASEQLSQVMKSILSVQLESLKKIGNEIEEENHPNLSPEIQNWLNRLDLAMESLDSGFNSLEEVIEEERPHSFLLEAWIDLGSILRNEVTLTRDSLRKAEGSPQMLRRASRLIHIGAVWGAPMLCAEDASSLLHWWEMFCEKRDIFLPLYESRAPELRGALEEIEKWGKTQKNLGNALITVQEAGRLAFVISLVKEVSLEDFSSLYLNALARGDHADLEALQKSKIFQKSPQQIVQKALKIGAKDGLLKNIEILMTLEGFSQVSNLCVNEAVAIAAQNGHFSIVELLMNLPIYEPVSEQVLFALEGAIEGQYVEVVRKVLNRVQLRGLFLTAQIENLLHKACQRPSLEIKRMLLENCPRGCLCFPAKAYLVLQQAALVGDIPTLEMVVRQSGQLDRFAAGWIDFVKAIQAAEKAGHSEFAERLRASPVFSRHPRSLAEAIISVWSQVTWARVFHFAVFESAWIQLAASGVSLPLFATAYAVGLLVSAFFAQLGQQVIAKQGGALVSPAATKRFLISNLATGVLAHLEYTRVGVLYPQFWAASFFVSVVANLYFAFQIRDYRPELLPLQ